MRIRNLPLLLIMLAAIVLPTHALSSRRLLLADGSVSEWADQGDDIRKLGIQLAPNRRAEFEPVTGTLTLTRGNLDHGSRAVETSDATTLRARAVVSGADRVIVPSHLDADLVVIESFIRTDAVTEPWAPEAVLSGFAMRHHCRARGDLRRLTGTADTAEDAEAPMATDCVDGDSLVRSGYGSGEVLSQRDQETRSAGALAPIGLHGCWPDGVALLVSRSLIVRDRFHGHSRTRAQQVHPAEVCVPVGETTGQVLCLPKQDGTGKFVARILGAGNAAEQFFLLDADAFNADHFAEPIRECLDILLALRSDFIEADEALSKTLLPIEVVGVLGILGDE